MLKITHNEKTGEYTCIVKEPNDNSLLITTELEEVENFVNAYALLYLTKEESDTYAW